MEPSMPLKNLFWRLIAFHHYSLSLYVKEQHEHSAEVLLLCSM